MDVDSPNELVYTNRMKLGKTNLTMIRMKRRRYSRDYLEGYWWNEVHYAWNVTYKALLSDAGFS